MGKKLGRGLEELFKESKPLQIEDTPIPTSPLPLPTQELRPAGIAQPVIIKQTEPPVQQASPASMVREESMTVTAPLILKTEAPRPSGPPIEVKPAEIKLPESISTAPPTVPSRVSGAGPQTVPLIGETVVGAPAVQIIPAPAFVPGMPETAGEALMTVNTEQLIPNRFQPRKIFDKESLTELIDSIRTAGVLQPILVRKSGAYFEIVAGERRWRACTELKLPKVPVIVKEVDDQKMLEWALIENTQRKDLNPIERARAYKELMTFFNLTQEEIARRVGLDRATVTNYMRLLDLPDEVQDDVAKESISTTHARSLLSIDDKQLQIKLAKRIRKEGLSVRRLEYIIKWIKRRRTIASQTAAPVPSQQLQIKEIEDRLMRKFNTKTIISSVDNKQGKIIISFYSIDDFQRILDKLDQIQ